MVSSTQSATVSAATYQSPPPDAQQPPSPQSAPQAPDWLELIKSTPRYIADAELAGTYAAALTRAAQDLPLPVTGSEAVYPVPVDSTFGQWRNHLDSLVAGDDFKQWAHANRVDLSRPLRIFPPSDTTPGWIQAYAKPSASGEAGARASILALGAQFSDGQSLPASWPLIMQTSKTLAAGNICVSVPSPGRSDPVTHATRPADLKDIAAFYGEQVPHSREALTERANDVKHANTFPLPGAVLSPAQFELRSETALEQQQREWGDVRNNTRLCQLLSTAITPPPASANATDSPPSFIDSPHTSEQAAQHEKTLIAQMLDSDAFKLNVDPTSWYVQDEQLAPEASVSLRRFITDKGWIVPQTKDDINNLIKSIQRGPLPSIPHGNLTGALSWAAALTLDEKKQLYSHIRFNNLKLPDLGASHAVNNEGGAFTYLTKNRHWTDAELNAPREIVEDILRSPKARTLEAALQRKMGVAGDTDGSDMTLAAILLGLDAPTAHDVSKRNECAGFDLAAPRFYGQPLSHIKQALIPHLAESGRCTARMAPVAAFMLLSSAAPELLVKDIPADVTYGSPAWATLKATVAYIEAKSPGSSSLMSFAEVVKYAAIDPVATEDQALLNAAKLDMVIDWALVHGVLSPSPTGRYSDEQLDTAQKAFSEVMSELQTTPGDITAKVPLLKDQALEELGKRYKNVPFELAVLTTPQARANNVLNNDILHTNTGPYSLLDLYLSGRAPAPQEDNTWYSLREQALPGTTTGLLHHLPDIKSVHRLAVANYQQRRESGLVTLSKHLIAQQPISDRKQLEYGKLEIFIEGTVIKHRVVTKSGAVNLDQSTPSQDPSKRALIIKSTHENKVKFYEFCPQHNYLKARDDLGSAFVPGPQGLWIKAPTPHLAGEKFSNTAITPFSVSQTDSHKLQAITPPADASVPASYNSARSQFLGELLSKHTLGDVELEQLVNASGHTTRFDEEDEEFERNREVLFASMVVVNPIRNVLNGDWLAVASDIVFDGVMYLTTAGLGKVAGAAAKPVNSALKQSGKPFGRRLFTQTPAQPSGGLNANFHKFSPGKTGQYDFSDLARKPDIAQGTYKRGLTEFSTPARFDRTTRKWYAVDPKTNKTYGKPLEDFKPQVSAAPGTSTPAMTPQQRALDIGLSRDNVIQMGGPMRDLKLIGNEVHTFTDTYKGTNRLNVVAHGIKRNWVERITGDGTKIIMDNTLYDAPGLAKLLRAKGVDLTSADNVRLLVCYSAEGRGKAFGRLFQQEINKPVKAFEGTVSLTHGSTSVTAIRNGVRNEVLRNYPNGTSAVIEQATDLLTEGLFNGKAIPHIQKNHGQTIRINIAPPGLPPIHDDLRITYRPRQFTR